MFLIYPSWALPISLIGRGLLYFGLVLYFALSAYTLERLSKNLDVNEPPAVCPPNVLKKLKEHVWLIVVCLVAVILHIAPISTPIYLIGDEALFLQNGLWIYDNFGAFWHDTVRYAFWTVLALMAIIVKLRTMRSSHGASQHQKAGRFIKPLAALLGAGILVLYFVMIRDLPFTLFIVRYPPMHNFLYLISYFVLGINYMGPRLWQLIFYLLSAIYLYRTIYLFCNKETALLGASILLFSPVIFSYAHFAEIASGLIFFIIIITYYFLRFLIYQDNRGLLLAAYFIGAGFLYKRDVFMMFFICSAYLFFHKFRKREFHLIRPLQILSLSLFPIIPWMIIGKLYNWRTAWVSLSQFTAFNKVIAYLLLIPEHMSWVFFFLYLISIAYVLISQKDHLVLFMGFLFMGYYAFYTSQAVAVAVHRFAMVFYPTVAVFIALLVSNIAQKIRWKHSFTLFYLVLTGYLIAICAVPSVAERLGTFRNVKELYFPNVKAMQWVRDNLDADEKILTFRFKPDLFYSDKYGIDKSKIHSFWYNLGEYDTPDKLLAYCRENKISYILFPYSPDFGDNLKNRTMRDYIKDDKNGEFAEVAKYNMDENFIYIKRIVNNL